LSATCGNGLPHSGSLDFADTEEDGGSNPVAPTSHRPSSGRVRGPGRLVQSLGARSSGSKMSSNRERTGGQTVRYRRSQCEVLLGGGRLPRGRVAGSRQHRWGDSNSTAPSCVVRGQEPTGRLSCGFFDPLATVSVHGCPLLRSPLRTQHGPRNRFVQLPSCTCFGTGVDQGWADG
jgi:hypothetical protein